MNSHELVFPPRLLNDQSCQKRDTRDGGEKYSLVGTFSQSVTDISMLWGRHETGGEAQPWSLASNGPVLLQATKLSLSRGFGERERYC